MLFWEEIHRPLEPKGVCGPRTVTGHAVGLGYFLSLPQGWRAGSCCRRCTPRQASFAHIPLWGSPAGVSGEESAPSHTCEGKIEGDTIGTVPPGARSHPRCPHCGPAPLGRLHFLGWQGWEELSSVGLWRQLPSPSVTWDLAPVPQSFGSHRPPFLPFKKPWAERQHALCGQNAESPPPSPW